MEACPACKYLAKDGVRCGLVNEKRFPFPLDAPCRPQMLREQEKAKQGLAECLAAKALAKAIKDL